MNISSFFMRIATWGLACVMSALLSACGGQVELLSAIVEADANEVIAALINNQVQATKVSGKEGMVGVRVPQTQTARAVDILRERGLPREQFSGMGQVFRKDGLISSPIEERARYLNALSQDLSGTLSRIDGVLFARVHLVLPERGSGSERDQPASAAVFIKHLPDSDLDVLQPQVRRLVVNSIPGLSMERVSVVLVASAPLKKSTPTFERFMGMQVAPDSVGMAQGLLAGLLALALASMSVAAYLGWRFLWKPRQAQRATSGVQA
jgi:type III secretion protein J